MHDHNDNYKQILNEFQRLARIAYYQEILDKPHHQEFLWHSNQL